MSRHKSGDKKFFCGVEYVCGECTWNDVLGEDDSDAFIELSFVLDFGDFECGNIFCGSDVSPAARLEVDGCVFWTDSYESEAFGISGRLDAEGSDDVWVEVEKFPVCIEGSDGEIFLSEVIEFF